MRHAEGLHPYPRMSDSPSIYLGIDCGATTTKVGAIDTDDTPITRELRQRPTRGEEGAGAIIEGWVANAEGFIKEQSLDWSRVAGVGLAIPGPYLSYGVLGKQANLPHSLEGWRFLDDLTAAIQANAGRAIPVTTANDGQLAGLGEARPIQAETPGSVLMLAPGSGLGCAFVHADGRLLEGDNNAAAILAHMPAPHAALGLPAFPCGCGRTWGCFEVYTAIAGLPHLIQACLPDHPDHPFASLDTITKKESLQLRGLAQQGDALALDVFNIQARAMGYAVATGAMAYDPTHIIIGGGLMDPESTTPRFRIQYIDTIRKTAEEVSWSSVEQLHFHEARLGELSQAIGAALLARSFA
ncbi:MAG: ROK family protein [Verrucomicrobiota bacterium]